MKFWANIRTLDKFFIYVSCSHQNLNGDYTPNSIIIADYQLILLVYTLECRLFSLVSILAIFMDFFELKVLFFSKLIFSIWQNLAATENESL